MAKSDFFFVESDYEYVLNDIIGKAIRFQVQFEGGNLSWANSELDEIAKDLEAMAKSFATSQGIDGSKNEGKFARGSPTILQGIKAYRQGGVVELVSLAKKQTTGTIIKDGKSRNTFLNRSTVSKRGHLIGEKEGGYYGGHVEYGHMLPDGGFYPARPYLRPALRVVSEASTGNLAGSLAATLSGQLSGFDQFTAAGEIARNVSHGQSSVLQFGKRSHFSPYYNRSTKKRDRKLSYKYSPIRGALDKKYEKQSSGSRSSGHVIPKMQTKTSSKTLGKKYSVKRGSSTGNISTWHTGKGYKGSSLLKETRYDKHED